ncbi:MAG TPA: hypothetical protein VF641_03255 [Methylobacterium sp.]|jgi:hypothetical protein
MQQVSLYDPMERQREKQRSRDQDDRDLRMGVVSHEELSARNGFFSSLNIAGSSIRRRRVLA